MAASPAVFVRETVAPELIDAIDQNLSKKFIKSHAALR